MTVAAVLLAAGSGSRVGAGVNKVLLPVCGDAVVTHALRTALGIAEITRIVLVVRDGDQREVADAIVPWLGEREVVLAIGGQTRHASETAALAALRDDILGGTVDVVAIHDAARPFATAALWRAVIEAARTHGGALPGLAMPGLIRRDVASAGADVVERDLVGVQTPQAFWAPDLLEAYDRAAADEFSGTDTAACLARYTEVRTRVIDGDARNIKVTFAEDLPLADALARRDAPA
ncbi:2-C-methyl-D-erythritol 4-phosphate cytidylyltransferase [Nocardioides sp. R-C-SC26]|uniref:IspD/TarI family cytidylyltransferase n=1 Tax=Nocardioides sp. R-C-SC26 TaxID=2870414 RepID=UPI001E4D5427|nr:IspD/TarI family cytidylyltransferase [Nocardioides sp. R-C-SC26]